MTTLRNMLGAVRRKETKAKSGSAPYHPTQRDRIIKAKLGFLERHIRTRKTVSTLPNVSIAALECYKTMLWKILTENQSKNCNKTVREKIYKHQFPDS